MLKKSVFCIATSPHRTEQMIANLRTAHFSSKDLSVVFPNSSALSGSGAQKDKQTGQCSVADAPPGGMGAVAWGWPNGLGPMNFAGVGNFTAAGPLLAALRDVANGETGVGMAARLIRLGVPVFEAQQYESRMKSGNILLALFLEDLAKIAQAKGILSETYGENLCTIDLLLAAQVVSTDHSLA